jgi:hypothetical protein
MHFGFMNVIVLHSVHRHVSATHAAIFRVVRAAVIQIYFVVCRNHYTIKYQTVCIVFKYGVVRTCCKCIRNIALTTLKMPHEWPKDVCGHYVIQLHSWKQREFVCLLINFMNLISNFN